MQRNLGVDIIPDNIESSDNVSSSNTLNLIPNTVQYSLYEGLFTQGLKELDVRVREQIRYMNKWRVKLRLNIDEELLSIVSRRIIASRNEQTSSTASYYQTQQQQQQQQLQQQESNTSASRHYQSSSSLETCRSSVSEIHNSPIPSSSSTTTTTTMAPNEKSVQQNQQSPFEFTFFLESSKETTSTPKRRKRKRKQQEQVRHEHIGPVKRVNSFVKQIYPKTRKTKNRQESRRFYNYVPQKWVSNEESEDTKEEEQQQQQTNVHTTTTSKDNTKPDEHTSPDRPPESPVL